MAAHTLCLTPISSKTASMTMSACSKWRCHDLEPSVRPTTLESTCGAHRTRRTAHGTRRSALGTRHTAWAWA
eukprot:4060138-Prymnesium_polylepis.1